MQGAVWACACAIAATNATIVKINDFWLNRLTLRVVTPPAAQWTALEKQGGSNARPIA